MAALRISLRVRRVLPLAFGAAVVVGTVAVVGTGPLLRGLLAVSPAALVAAALLTAVATGAAAWRWRAVSSELGLPMSWPSAVAAYYRSQFVNTVLPGGVVGDVHRAYRHGARTGELPMAARAVATERAAGQLVQAVATVIVLGALGVAAPLFLTFGWAAAAMAFVLVIALALAMASRRVREVLRRELSLLRSVFRTPRASLSIAAASLVVVAAHAGTFIVACLAVGIVASPRELLGLALIALAAASLPVNVGGWGPREAVSAAAFAAVGLGAGTGLATSTAFGVLTLAAVLPGAGVLIADQVTTRVARSVEIRTVARARVVPTVHPLPEERAA